MSLLLKDRDYVADGSGGVKKAGAGDQGQEYLVVSVDDGYATVRM